MANFSVSGLDEFMLSMQQVAELPDAVIDDMLKAGADVVAEAQRKEAATVLRGPYATGETALSIEKGRVKLRRDGSRIIYVTPTGNRKRGKRKGSKTRNAEIAFVNEFGVPHRGIPARPFISVANEKSAAATTAAQAAVYNKFLESKNL